MDTRTAAARIEFRRREAIVLEGKIKGETFAALAVKIGISRRNTIRIFQRALSRISAPVAAESRKVILQRLDALRERLFKALEVERDANTQTHIVAELRKLDETECRITGLFIPQRLIVDSFTPRRESEERITVDRIRARLTPDEMREWLRINSKLTAPPEPAAIETSASEVSPLVGEDDDFEEFKP